MSEIKVDYKIEENFLDKEAFKFMREQFLGQSVPWFYQTNVVEEDVDNDFYLAHQIYSAQTWHSNVQLVAPLLEALDVKALVRIKANLYPRSENLIVHKNHVDAKFSHTSALLYINTCNGYTQLEDGTKIESVANRLLIIDGSKPHCSTNCTDEPARVNVGVNFF